MDMKEFTKCMAVRRAADKRPDNLAGMGSSVGSWPKVFICAPYDPEVRKSWEKIWWYCRFALEYRCIPVAPEWYFSLFMLVEPDQPEKDMADVFALKALVDCDEVWVFGNEFTPLMKRALMLAGLKGKFVRYFPDWEEVQKEYCKEDCENE